MKYVFLLTALLASFHAGAYQVSEEKVNEFIQAQLAERHSRNVQLVSPHVILQAGFATFCTEATSKYVANKLNFCANFTPKWEQTTGSLHATKISLKSFSAEGADPAKTELFRSIVNQMLLPSIEGIELYRTDNLMGKQISEIRVLPGKLDLVLW